MTGQPTSELLSSLRERGVRLWVENDRLKCEAPSGVLDDELRARLVERKEDLIVLLAHAEARRGAPRSLVPLKPTGDLPALFARPGHNGDVFCYRDLAEHLDPNRPLYAVEPRGLDGSPVPETIEEMARYEVEQIRMAQPEGPYFLAGYCAGGAVAFESARQLAEAGQEVARVVLFGSPFPTVFREGRARLYLRSLSQRARRHTDALRGGSLRQGADYIWARLRGRATAAAMRLDPSLANRRRVEEATVDAVKRYTPLHYDGRLDVVFPSEAWRSSGDRPGDWRLVATHVVEHVGPAGGDGDAMLREPHVRATAALLEEALDELGGGRHAAD